MSREIAVVDGEQVDRDTGEVLPVRHSQAFDLAQVEHPTAAIRVAEELVAYMAAKCTGKQYISHIQGRQYPRVEWWTTVGAALALYPREESTRRRERNGELVYEATVGVYRGDQLVTRGSSICSSREKWWSTADEYAIRSMAVTRATGKAYRLGLSFLAVMAGLEATPAEEMPGENGNGHGRRSEPAQKQRNAPKNPEPATQHQIDQIKALLIAAEISPEKYMQIEGAIKAEGGVSSEWAATAIAGLEKRTRPEDLEKVQKQLAANGIAAEEAEQDTDLPFGDDDEQAEAPLEGERKVEPASAQAEGR